MRQKVFHLSGSQSQWLGGCSHAEQNATKKQTVPLRGLRLGILEPLLDAMT